MKLLLPLLLLAGCMPTAPSEPPVAPPVEATDGTARGEVVAVDMEPMAYDGDGVVTVLTDEGETVRVLIAARMNLCPAEGLGLAGDLQPGDRVTINGRVFDDSIRPCESEGHFLRRL